MNDISADSGELVPFPLGGLVLRSAVEKKINYLEYRQDLRLDFYFSCAYCTMMEAEALGVRFTIDHYEPQSIRPDLKFEYSNLMYACDECNIRKGDLSPPESARLGGMRFFRPDTDYFDDHFKEAGLRVEGASPIGAFTVEYVDLNRQALRRLRDFRNRMAECHEEAADGILRLRNIRIDRIPKQLKGKVSSAIGRIQSMQAELDQDIDTLLRKLAYSELLDPDPEAAARSKQRALALEGAKKLHPGIWRAPRRARPK